jgi:6-phosphogluconolactonase (cycloisomerase 2 family)
MSDGLVFVQTNEPENAVVVFRRAADGALMQAGSQRTGGAGDGEPHLTSQGSVVLTGDGRHLLVTNAASDDVSVLAVSGDGNLQLAGRSAAGPAPKSIAERDGLVYVLSTVAPAVSGFRLREQGLEALPRQEPVPLGAHADPAQVGFTPDGSALIVTERGTNSITTIPLSADGTAGSPQSTPSSGPTPYGFAVTSGGILVVTEAFGAHKGAAAASSYSVDGATLTPVTKSAGNGRSEICWAVVTPDGRYAFTTNFADGAVSCYSIRPDGGLVLQDAAAGIAVEGQPGLRDEGLSADGRYLYAIDADSGSIYAWAVRENGSLSALGSWGGLPVTVAGLAAS